MGQKRRPFYLVSILGLLASCGTFRSLPDASTLGLGNRLLRPYAVVGAHGAVDPATRERISRRLSALGADNVLGRHLAAMESLSDTPLIASNRVALLVDGPRAYAAMFAAISAAHDHVNVEMYIFDEAQSAARLLSDVLVERARAGVAVNVLYDAVGSSDTPAALFDKLRAAGVELCAFNPLSPAANRTRKFTQRDHRKVVVVDGQVAFTGGINFSSTYSSGSRSKRSGAADALRSGWRDTQIQVEGPATLQMQRLFFQSWGKQHCAAVRAANYLPPARAAGATLLRLDASSSDSQRNETYAAALTTVMFAQQSIDLTMAYFAPDEQLEQALKEAARRGVRVRLLLAGVSDFRGILYAGRAHYASLLKAGVLIYEERRSLLHAKTLQVDGIWSTVGSANWDWLSFANNDELNVVVIDTGFATEMQTLFADDLRTATPITVATWAQRSLRERLLERFWLTWDRFL